VVPRAPLAFAVGSKLKVGYHAVEVHFHILFLVGLAKFYLLVQRIDKEEGGLRGLQARARLCSHGVNPGAGETCRRELELVLQVV